MAVVFFFQAEDGIRDLTVTGVQTCALPISTIRRLEGEIEEAAQAFYPTELAVLQTDRKSTPLNSSHSQISYAVFCLKKKKKKDSSLVSLKPKRVHQRQLHYTCVV